VQQAELALAREISLNVQLANDLEGRTSARGGSCRAVCGSGPTLVELRQMVDFDRNCSLPELQKHLANLGLSADAIDNIDIEQLLRRFFAVDLASDRTLEAEALLDVIQNVRQARRFDLVELCESLRSGPDEDSRLTKEFILLYIDAGEWQRLRRFIELRPNISVDLKSRTILQLLAQHEPRSEESIAIWPNEQVTYAAKTSIFNVSAAVVNRQRYFIEVLLKRLSEYK
jgi:hypothetical protein